MRIKLPFNYSLIIGSYFIGLDYVAPIKEMLKTGMIAKNIFSTKIPFTKIPKHSLTNLKQLSTPLKEK